SAASCRRRRSGKDLRAAWREWRTHSRGDEERRSAHRVREDAVSDVVTEARNDIPSVVERTRPVKADAGVVGAHFLGDTAVLVLGEEELILVPRAGEPRTVAAHGGAVLCSSADADRVVTGGDDGKVVATAADGKFSVIATDGKRRWIDHVAAGPNGAFAWSA